MSDDIQEQDPQESKPRKRGGKSVKNTSKNPRAIGGNVVAPGDSVTLSARELKDEKLMAKIKHCCKLGVLDMG